MTNVVCGEADALGERALECKERPQVYALGEVMLWGV